MVLYNKRYNKNCSFCKITLLLPEIKYSKFVYNIYGDSIKSRKLSFPTYFILNSNKIYINIGVSVLGFGIQFQVHE